MVKTEAHWTAGHVKPLTNGVAALDGVGRVMQRREAGVGPAALELYKQSFLGRAGEVARALEGAVGAAGTLFLLKDSKFKLDQRQKL